MKNSLFLFTVAALCLSFSAFALNLSSAKAEGLVGETPSGYLAAVKNTPEAQKLVKSVNAKRKAKYQELAKKNGISLAQVETMAGKKTFKKTAKGHYVKVNGKWVKK